MRIPDGIWVGLDHALHVADDALGGGDLKSILQNAVQWAARKRNPVWKAILNRDPPQRAAAKAMGTEFGTALHTILLEPDDFDKRYAVLPPVPDLPNTKEEINAELIALGAAPLPLSKKSVFFEAAARMHGIRTLQDWREEQAEASAGRIQISESWELQLRTTKRVLELHSQAGKFLRNGRAEVSVFWTDEHGHRYKVRFDYLRVRTVADVKTYLLPEDRAAVETFNQSRSKYAYEVAAAQYMYARKEILPDLVRRGRVYIGNPALDEDGDVTAVPAGAEDLKFFADVAAYIDPRWWWIACATGGFPEVDSIEFRQDITAWASAMYQVEQAKETYRAFRAKFGDDDDALWMDDRGLVAITDDHFSRAALNRGAALHDTLEG